jgi:hypothetical protein
LDSLVFAAVLFAAACHAGWNAAIKIGSDTLSATALIAVGAGIFGVALSPFVGFPLAAAWPWVVASVVINMDRSTIVEHGALARDPGRSRVWALAPRSSLLISCAEWGCRRERQPMRKENRRTLGRPMAWLHSLSG